MKNILAYIDYKQKEFTRLPLFDFLQDNSIDPKRRLAFAPAIAAFTMNFAELNKSVFRDEQSTDDIQRIVNIHTYEDDCHWPWLLKDIQSLGYNKTFSFNDALEFFWSQETIKSREAANFLYRMTYQSSPIQKFVVIEATEATANVVLGMSAIPAQQLQAITKQEYLYFGSNHFNADSSHTSFSTESRKFLESIEIAQEDQNYYLGLVDQTFMVFSDFMAELLAFAQNTQVEERFQPHANDKAELSNQLLRHEPVASPYTDIKPLGSYLIEANLVTAAQIEKALHEQVNTSMRLGEVLANHNWISQETIEYMVEKVVLPERRKWQRQNPNGIKKFNKKAINRTH